MQLRGGSSRFAAPEIASPFPWENSLRGLEGPIQIYVIKRMGLNDDVVDVVQLQGGCFQLFLLRTANQLGGKSPEGFKAGLLDELAQVYVSVALSISKDGSSPPFWVPV